MGLYDLLSSTEQRGAHGGRAGGVAVGIVTDNADPAGMGRVKLRFPWKADGDESTWARVATFMAGNGRGSWFLPEVGDEVLVAFEHGDVQHPYVLGALWNGQDAPPGDNGDGQNNIRKITSRSGHEMLFDDTSGAEKVVIKSNGGHSITMDDAPGRGKIVIETASGHSITLDDTPGSGGITVRTAGGMTAALTDTPPSLSVRDTSGNSASLEAAGITVNAAAKATINASMLEISAGVLTVNAGMATFSGVVQAQTVITNSVVSPSYTPGAGNIW